MIELAAETQSLEEFRRQNPDLFKKEDRLLLQHIGMVLSLLFISIALVILTPSISLKIILGAWNAFLWFSLVNATIHHHHTHHNAASNTFTKKLLDLIYLVVIPNAPKRKSRYTRVHLNHHARPFHETDIDHHYGKNHYLKMNQNLLTRIFYFLELTFVGGHVPGWEDDRYMSQVPLENWNQKDYEKVKQEERKKAVGIALLQWGLFGIALWWLPAVAWGWAFPMLLVKNWAHYLGQFQHYDDRFLDPGRSALNRARTYHIPSWFNYLAGGEISGHFLHHLFPEMPYYKIETARKRFLKDPKLNELFMTY